MNQYTKESLAPILEAIIFASEEPLSVNKIYSLLTGEANSNSKQVAMKDQLVTGLQDKEDEPEFAEWNKNVIDSEPTHGSNQIDTESDINNRMSEQVVLGKKGQLNHSLIRDTIEWLNSAFAESSRVFRIVEVAGGFQFATIAEYGRYVGLLAKDKIKRRLSPAALETLSIVAYRQPVTKPEVEAIRGVNSDQVMVALMEKNLIAITGRSETVGKPLLYSTTDDFLRAFGLKSVKDLPKLREIDELLEEGAYAPMKPEVLVVSPDDDVEKIEEAVAHAAKHAPEEENI